MEAHMIRLAGLFVAACLGMATGASAQVRGTAVWVGRVPPPKVFGPIPGVGAIQDEVVLVGKNNGLKNVVVYVKDGAKLDGQAPGKPAVLDVRGTVYVPHVLPVVLGQELRVRNGDAVLHMAVGQGKKNAPFEAPLPGQGQEQKVDGAKAVETYRMRCGVHPWMTAWVVVLDHPFFAVTADDGSFEIRGLKPGKHTLVAWHERSVSQEADVEVGADGKLTKAVEFKFNADN
jgi:hypothetical protein